MSSCFQSAPGKETDAAWCDLLGRLGQLAEAYRHRRASRTALFREAVVSQQPMPSLAIVIEGTDPGERQSPLGLNAVERGRNDDSEGSSILPAQSFEKRLKGSPDLG